MNIALKPLKKMTKNDLTPFLPAQKNDKKRPDPFSAARGCSRHFDLTLTFNLNLFYSTIPTT